MIPIGTLLFTWFRGTFVGEDRFGNRYYRGRGKSGPNVSERRWVLYKGMAEASKIPPEWHGWMHHTHDTPPTREEEARQHAWQQEHQPNLTGTRMAYLPAGHILKGGERPPVSADYQPWQP